MEQGNEDIAASDVNYVKKHYGTASIVFDGYEGPTTKDSEHARREKYTSHSVRIHEENEIKSNQDRFLSNRDNKVQIILLLAAWLYRNGNEVFVCKGDADCKIVSVTLSIAKEKPVIVVAGDTDIAILLLKHWMDHMQEIIFFTEKSKRLWNKSEKCRNMGEFRYYLPFIHAWSGCDTTSSIFNKGKPSFLNLVKKSVVLREAGRVFYSLSSTKDGIAEVGYTIFKLLYGGKSEDSLNKLRYFKYLDMAYKGIIEPEKLPPTQRTAYFHSLRVYLQVN